MYEGYITVQSTKSKGYLYARVQFLPITPETDTAVVAAVMNETIENAITQLRRYAERRFWIKPLWRTARIFFTDEANVPDRVQTAVSWLLSDHVRNI